MSLTFDLRTHWLSNLQALPSIPSRTDSPHDNFGKKSVSKLGLNCL